MDNLGKYLAAYEPYFLDESLFLVLIARQQCFTHEENKSMVSFTLLGQLLAVAKCIATYVRRCYDLCFSYTISNKLQQAFQGIDSRGQEDYF